MSLVERLAGRTKSFANAHNSIGHQDQIDEEEKSKGELSESSSGGEGRGGVEGSLHFSRKRYSLKQKPEQADNSMARHAKAERHSTLKAAGNPELSQSNINDSFFA